MSTATWGEPEPQIEEQYPLSLLKTLLQQMMRQFGANGAVIALLGAGSLAVEFVLPRLFAAAEQAQGSGLYDPALQGDPMLVRPHHLGVRILGCKEEWSGTDPVHPIAVAVPEVLRHLSVGIRAMGQQRLDEIHAAERACGDGLISF